MPPLAPLVRANGAAIPALGLGTWAARGGDCAAAVAHALKVGYRHIDTAAMYGNEEEVGEGMRVAGVPRDEVFVTTKVWPSDIGWGALQRSAEASLRRLGLDAVDLLLIHWPNPAIPLADSIRALCDARRQGLARHVGVSNFPVVMLEEALRLAEAPLVANQCEYHPHLDQSKLLAACRRHGLAFAAYCPLGRGTLVADGTVQAIAAARGRTPAQVLLRWHVQQEGVIALPKSANPARIAENFSIFDFTLSDAEMARLSGLAHARGRVVDIGGAPAWD